MRIVKITTLSLLLTYLLGCASMNTPSSSLITEIPVITIGDTNHPPERHIVFIPANTEFPINFSAKGNVFNKAVSSKVMVSFKNDVYLYKYWASLDGKTWVSSHKLLNVEPSGGFDASGGKIEVKLDFSK